MRPDFGHVVDVPLVLLPFCFGYHLDIHGPRRVLPINDVLIQVLAGVVGVLASSGEGLLVGEVLDALVCFEGVLDEVRVASVVHPLEGVGTVAMHVSVASRGASIRVHNGDGMYGLGRLTEEVPHGVGVEHVLDWVGLQSVEEVGGLHRVPEEEDGEVYSQHVVVALFGVELDGEAPDVAEQVGGAATADGRGEAAEDLGALAHGAEELGLGEHGQVVGHLEVAVGTHALGVRCSLRNPFSVEFLDFVDEV